MLLGGSEVAGSGVGGAKREPAADLHLDATALEAGLRDLMTERERLVEVAMKGEQAAHLGRRLRPADVASRTVRLDRHTVVAVRRRTVAERMLLVVAKPAVREADRERMGDAFGNGHRTSVIAAGDLRQCERVAHDAEAGRPVRDAHGIVVRLREVQQPARVEREAFRLHEPVDPPRHLERSCPFLGRRVAPVSEQEARQPSVTDLAEQLSDDRESDAAGRRRHRQPEERERAIQVLAGLQMLASPEEGLTHAPLDPRALHGIPAVAERPRVRRDGLLVVRESLGIPGDLFGALARLEQVVLRSFPALGAGEVIREHAVELLEACCEEPLDRLAGEGVQLPSALQQDALVGRVVDQRVLEDVLELGRARALTDEVEVPELGERDIEGLRFLREGAEQAVEERAADDRGELEHALDVVVEPIDVRDEQPLHGVRDRDPVEGIRRTPLATLLVEHDRAEIEEHADDLFDEEGIALCLFDYDRIHVRRDPTGGQQVARELFAVRTSERGEAHFDESRRVIAPGPLSQSRDRAFAVVRAARDADTEPLRLDERQQVLEQRGG